MIDQNFIVLFFQSNNGPSKGKPIISHRIVKVQRTGRRCDDLISPAEKIKDRPSGPLTTLRCKAYTGSTLAAVMVGFERGFLCTSKSAISVCNIKAKLHYSFPFFSS